MDVCACVLIMYAFSVWEFSFHVRVESALLLFYAAFLFFITIFPLLLLHFHICVFASLQSSCVLSLSWFNCWTSCSGGVYLSLVRVFIRYRCMHISFISDMHLTIVTPVSAVAFVETNQTRIELNFNGKKWQQQLSTCQRIQKQRNFFFFFCSCKNNNSHELIRSGSE